MSTRFDQQRSELRERQINDLHYYRVLCVGRFTNGSTDIVACLIRSLRNLGHHVLHVDPKEHRGLLSNPNGHQGGQGPIHVNLEMLDGAIKRFRPQMIVLLAGGMAFRPEDAEALKARGIVLVGITLSDPDVFDSVSTFSSDFDFHTSNAQVALDMYKEANITNTLYFPFAVDRAFVTQDINVPTDLNADVICLGHATARPERDEVMNRVYDRLSDDFMIRTYGRGWTLPASKVVEGTEMLAASRGGRVHVNFPATRAGYTNVKCGVFETIAGGGLLATQRFDEMAHFFDYDSEILGYNDYDDLVDQLEKVLSSPGQVEEMSAKAFERLVSEHLYEHRWAKLFGDIRDLLEHPPSWLNDDRVSVMRETLREDCGRARPIMLSGFYGARNIGDDLIMRSIADSVEGGVAGGQVYIVAQNFSEVKLSHGYNSVNRTNHEDGDNLLRSMDAILVGGGGLWHDYTFQQAGGLRSLYTGSAISIAGFGILPMIANLRSIPFHVVGLGVGPLSNPDAKRLVKHVGGTAESITVRDPHSKVQLDEIFQNNKKINYAPDTVYAIKDLNGVVPPDIEELAKDHRLVAVNLRPWTREEVTTEVLVRRIAAIIERMCTDTKEKIAVVALPMQEGATFDRASLAGLTEKLANICRVVDLPEPLNFENFFGALEACDVLISMRLHACLVAHRLGKPVVGLAYDPKVVTHFEEVKRSDYCFLLNDCTEENIELALSKAMKSGLQPKSTKSIRALEKAATKGLDAVISSIAKCPSRSTVWEIPLELKKAKPAAKPGRKVPVREVSDTDFEIDIGSHPIIVKSDRLSVIPKPASDGNSQRSYGVRRFQRHPQKNIDVQSYLESLNPIIHPTFVETNNYTGSNKESHSSSVDMSYQNEVSIRFAREDGTSIDTDGTHLRISSRGFSFAFDKDGPAKNESMTASMAFEPIHGALGRIITFEINSHYERARNAGYIAMQILWGGRVLGEEDIASQSGGWKYSVYCKSESEGPLSIRLIAKNNCRNWNWPEATRLIITDLSVLATDWDEEPRIVTLNPHFAPIKKPTLKSRIKSLARNIKRV